MITIKTLLETAEDEMATATYQTLKDFEAEMRKMFEDPLMYELLPPHPLTIIRKILGEE